ncbi:MAG: hypothetical protein RR219_08325 [Clostridiales bacterium]
MKLIKKRMIWSCTLAVLGLIFLIITLTTNDLPRNAFLSGMSGALLIVGLLKTIQYIRIAKNPKWVQKFEIQQNEERLKFLVNKSATIVFFGSVFAEFIGACAFALLNMITYATAISYIVCAQLLIYYVVFYLLNKKY